MLAIVDAALLPERLVAVAEAHAGRLLEVDDGGHFVPRRRVWKQGKTAAVLLGKGGIIRPEGAKLAEDTFQAARTGATVQP